MRPPVLGNRLYNFPVVGHSDQYNQTGLPNLSAIDSRTSVTPGSSWIMINRASIIPPSQTGVVFPLGSRCIPGHLLISKDQITDRSPRRALSCPTPKQHLHRFINKVFFLMVSRTIIHQWTFSAPVTPLLCPRQILPFPLGHNFLPHSPFNPPKVPFNSLGKALLGNGFKIPFKKRLRPPTPLPHTPIA